MRANRENRELVEGKQRERERERVSEEGTDLVWPRHDRLIDLGHHRRAEAKPGHEEAGDLAPVGHAEVLLVGQGRHERAHRGVADDVQRKAQSPYPGMV